MVDLPAPDDPVISVVSKGLRLSADSSALTPSKGWCRRDAGLGQAQIGFGQQARQLDDAGAVIGDDKIGLGLDRGERVLDGDGAAARAEEGLVVLGVADADDIVRRQAEALERALEAPGLVDVAGQHHHRALVEDDVQLERKVVDGLEHDRLVRFPGGDDGAADRRGRHAEVLQTLHERRRRRLGERGFLLLCGVEEKGPVLGNDEVEQLQLREGPLQVGKVPAGDEDQLSAGALDLLQPLDGRRIDAAIVGQGAVVVGRQGNEEHVAPPLCGSAQEEVGQQGCACEPRHDEGDE